MMRDGLARRDVDEFCTRPANKQKTICGLVPVAALVAHPCGEKFLIFRTGAFDFARSRIPAFRHPRILGAYETPGPYKTSGDENIYTDFSGKRIYFDSEESRQAFLKDTDKYEETIKNVGVPLNSKPPRKPQKSQKDCAT